MKILAASLITIAILNAAAWAQTPASQPDPTLKELVENADLVVVAKVIDTDPNTGKPLPAAGGEKRNYIQILKTLKGEKLSENPVRIFPEGLQLAVGKTYVLFFATRSNQAGIPETMKQPLLEATDKNIKVVAREVKDWADIAATDLIRQLGDPEVNVRDEAGKSLIEMGDPALPMLIAKAQEPNLPPDVSSRVLAVLRSPRQSPPVQAGDADFQIVAPAVWVRLKETAIPLALKITNRADKARQFNLYDTVTICIKDANGHELPLGGGRRETLQPRPLLVEKDQSGTIDREAQLKQQDKAFRLTGSDGAGGVWWFDGLKAGKYTVSIAYESTQAAADNLVKNGKADDGPFWIGKVVTKELAIEIVDEPVGTRPVTRP